MSSKKQAANSLDNMKPLMDERADLYRSKKRIEDRIAEVDEVLRPALVGRGEVVWNGFAFKVDEVAGRKTYDTKAMAADGIDIEKYAKVGAPSSRFTIKPVTEI